MIAERAPRASSARPWSCSRSAADDGLVAAIGNGRFGDVKRTETGGKGLDGVVERRPDYFNPFLETLTCPDGQRVAKVSAAKQPIRAYGDRRDDGVVQLSFTLPVPLSEKAKEAARQFCKKLGLQRREGGLGMEAAAGQLHLLRRLRRTHVVLDYAAIDVPEVVFKKLGFDELNDADRGASSGAGSSCSAPAPAPTRTPSASTPS